MNIEGPHALSGALCNRREVHAPAAVAGAVGGLRDSVPFDVEGAKQRLAEHSMPEPNSGCVLWLRSVAPFGYGILTFGKKVWNTHRLAWVAYNGPIPDGLCVLHKCDVPGCLNPKHLFLGTRGDNCRDMIAKGRHAGCAWGRTKGAGGGPGVKHYRARFTDEQVLAIRSDSRRQCDIARAYGVAQTTIASIRNRQNWKHI